MNDEERTLLKLHNQNKLESIKNEVAWITNLPKQFLRSKNGEGTSTQPPIETPTTHVSYTS